jgi:poly(A) polymerase
LGGSRRKHFVARALNKNKKPESIIKRARNYFLGSFGSPCSFSLL